MCHGVQMHVTDRENCDLFEAGMILLDEIRKQAGDKFEILCHVLEMDGETKRFYHIDRLLGSDEYRLGKLTTAEIVEKYKPGVAAFTEASKKYHLYD